MNIERVFSFNSLASADLTKIDGLDVISAFALTINATGGRNGGPCLRIGQPSNTVQIPFSGNLSEVGIGMAISPGSGWFTSGYRLWSIYDNATRQIDVVCRSDFKLDIKNGSGTLLATTVNTFNPMDHLYIRAVIHNSAGVLEIRKNGALDQAILTGLDTQNSANAYGNFVYLTQAGLNTSATFDVDDIYIANALDADSTFPGDLHFRTRTVTGAGSSAAWTPSAGSNYQNVDEATQNGDTDYNETASNVDDLFTGTTLSGSGAVRCAVVNFWARKPEGGNSVLRGIIKAGATTHVGADVNPSVDYRMYQGILDDHVDIDTLTEANAVEFGYRKVS